MSGNDYPSYSSYYSHSQNSNNYQVPNPTHLWGNWSVHPPPPPPPPPPPYLQNYGRNSNPPNHHNRDNRDRENHNQNHNAHGPNNHMSPNNHAAYRPHGFHDSPARLGRVYFRKRPNPNGNNMHNDGPINVDNVPNWQARNQNNFKRSRLDFPENEPQLKTTKKKKKPLSQNIPHKKDWTLEEAQLALLTEKEHNKKSRNALIIKFPDQELNKNIVAQFHPSIESVHFQQPCTPRFCFVMLQESADPNEVISALNKQKFGDGYLSVEYKKDREEDQAVAAGDIDPLTLYVGNLAQEITKEDMVNLFPTNRRIDIGYAKKMKFTRYAFVGFRTVADSIEAFKNTYNKQMYNKSLIVRFRRLHGTVGMPGESKPQNPPKAKDNTAAVPSTSDADKTRKDSEVTVVDSLELPPSTPSVIEENYETNSDTTDIIGIDRIKQEQDSEDESKHNLGENSYLSISADVDDYLHFRHSPIVNHIKEEVKDKEENETDVSLNAQLEVPNIKTEPQQAVRIKDEPYDSDEGSQCNGDEYMDDEYFGNEDAGSDESEPTNFSEIFATMREHQERIQPLKKT